MVQEEYIVKMTYINTETEEIGTLYQLLPKVSSPIKLSDEELLALNIEKYVAPEVMPTLDEVKENKLKELKVVHQQIKTEGFITSLGFKIDCEDKNVNDFANGKQLLDVAGLDSINVVDYDNVTRELTAEQYTNMVVELGAYMMQLLMEKQTLRDLVNEATTIEEAKDVYWRTPIYEDEQEIIISGYEYNTILGRQLNNGNN